jgi:carbohydrate-selective porin OprB
VEQTVTRELGLFGRASWADGATETYAFTEIDRSVSGGVVLKGAAWGRGQDIVGIAYARNGLSDTHREYLARGGLGFFLGDGRLRYRPESLVEMFYNFRATRHAWISLDVQRIENPAYNADRGPVLVTGARLHAEF